MELSTAGPAYKPSNFSEQTHLEKKCEKGKNGGKAFDLFHTVERYCLANWRRCRQSHSHTEGGGAAAANQRPAAVAARTTRQSAPEPDQLSRGTVLFTHMHKKKKSQSEALTLRSTYQKKKKKDAEN